jgi:DNA-binding protein H-NS
MKNGNQQSVDERFWQLYDSVVAERDLLEKLVRELSVADNGGKPGRDRRPYPEAHPKYRNPKNQTETWCGRGCMPRSLTAELEAGKKLRDLLIDPIPALVEFGLESSASPPR